MAVVQRPIASSILVTVRQFLTILQVERIVVVTVLTTNFMFILVRPVRLQLKVLEILRMSSRAVRQDYMPLCSVVEIPAGVAVAMVID